MMAYDDAQSVLFSIAKVTRKSTYQLYIFEEISLTLPHSLQLQQIPTTVLFLKLAEK